MYFSYTDTVITALALVPLQLTHIGVHDVMRQLLPFNDMDWPIIRSSSVNQRNGRNSIKCSVFNCRRHTHSTEYHKISVRNTLVDTDSWTFWLKKPPSLLWMYNLYSFPFRSFVGHIFSIVCYIILFEESVVWVLQCGRWFDIIFITKRQMLVWQVWSYSVS